MLTGRLGKLAIGAGVALIIMVFVAFRLDGPRFVTGLMTYGTQAREGTLQVGDPTPAVTLYSLDAMTPRALADWAADRAGGKPLVLVFGSFT